MFAHWYPCSTSTPMHRNCHCLDSAPYISILHQDQFSVTIFAPGGHLGPKAESAQCVLCLSKKFLSSAAAAFDKWVRLEVRWTQLAVCQWSDASIFILILWQWYEEYNSHTRSNTNKCLTQLANTNTNRSNAANGRWASWPVANSVSCLVLASWSLASSLSLTLIV